MKTKISYSLLAAAMACGIAQGQTAYTTPVGYITVAVAANPGGPSETYVAPTLIQPTEFAGLSTASPSGTKTISFSGGVPTTFGSKHVLEISSGISEGWWSTVVSSTATSVTVLDNFPASLPTGVQVSVRKHNTVKSFLGANAPGLVPFDGTVVNDEVQLLNAAADPQSVTALAYVPASLSGEPADAWFNLGTSSNADNDVIEPGTAIRIKRFSSTPTSFVTSGEVKVTDTQVDIYSGFTWVGTPSAAGNTLGGMNFASQLVPFDGNVVNFDELQILAPTQLTTAYASLDPSLGFGVVMGNLGTSSDASTDPFAEGTGAVLKRDTSVADGVITLPGTVVAP